MRPKPGTELHVAVEQLRGCVSNLQNVRAQPNLPEAREFYVIWVDEAERCLRALFESIRLGELHTERYWRIRDIGGASARPWELIYSEADVQTERLKKLADELEAGARRLSVAPGEIVVPDTNVFLHFRRFDEIDWTMVLDAAPLRMVIPIRVIKELDEKKASRRTDLADRARGVLARLESFVGPTDGAPTPLREHVTVEVLVDMEADSDRREPETNADSEILDAAEYLAFLTSQPATVVTGDASMRLRAAARGLRVASMPDELALKPADQ